VVLSKKKYLQDFILANLVGGRNRWVGDLLTDEAEECYDQWRSRNESLTYRFREQLVFLDDDFDSNFVVPEHAHPKLLQLMVEGSVWPETPIVFNQLLHYSRQWDKKMSDDFMWSQWRQFVLKYDVFVQYDREKIKSLIISKFGK
jgi:hypothetical protein